MIVKDYEIPIKLHQLETLDRRLQLSNRMKDSVIMDLKKERSGIKGEKEVGYQLRFLDEEDNLIFHNLRLPDQNGLFQIDALVLCERYILILEVKNWYGTILFGKNGQVIRIGDDKTEEGFPNPVSQVKLQQYRLQKWLRQHGVSDIPVEYFVVISFPSTIIKSSAPTNLIPECVIHNNQLLFNIQNLDNHYTSRKISKKQLKLLSKQLVEAHTPPSEDILEKYNLTSADLIKGVICPDCSTVPMIKKHQCWFCEKCKHVSVDTHLQALMDYKLLISEFITNRDARDFLQVESPYIVKRILKDSLSYTGNTKRRIYKL